MAVLNDLHVFVQQKTGDQGYEDLHEAESQDTIKDGASSALLTTKVVEARPGEDFRFRILCGEDFIWGDYNALEILLTFDEGYEMNRHKLVIFKAGVEQQQLAGDCRTDQMVYAPNADGRSSFIIHHIATPPSSGSTLPTSTNAWAETSFVFKKLHVEHNRKSGRKSYTSTSELGRLKVQITPVYAVRSKSRIKLAYDPKPDHGGQYEQSKQIALEEKLTLTTALKQSSEILLNEHYCAVKRTDPARRYTFVFLYREAGTYEKLDEDDIEVEEGQTTKAQKKALQSTPTSLQLSPLSYGSMDSGDDDDNVSTGFTAINAPQPQRTPDPRKRRPAPVLTRQMTPSEPSIVTAKPTQNPANVQPLTPDSLPGNEHMVAADDSAQALSTVALTFMIEVPIELALAVNRLTDWVRVYNENIRVAEAVQVEKLQDEIEVNFKKVNEVRNQKTQNRVKRDDLAQKLEGIRLELDSLDIEHAQLNVREDQMLHQDEDLHSKLHKLQKVQETAMVLKPPSLNTFEKVMDDDMKEQQKIKDRNDKKRRRSKLSTDSTQDLRNADRAKRLDMEDKENVPDSRGF